MKIEVSGDLGNHANGNERFSGSNGKYLEMRRCHNNGN
jgi:hypothetical protein